MVIAPPFYVGHSETRDESGYPRIFGDRLLNQPDGVRQAPSLPDHPKILCTEKKSCVWLTTFGAYLKGLVGQLLGSKAVTRDQGSRG